MNMTKGGGRRGIAIAALCAVVALIYAGLTHRPNGPITSAAPASASASPEPALNETATGTDVASTPVRTGTAGARLDYIVQASSIALARQAVERVGGVVQGDLEIIRAVGAALDERELAALWEKPVDGLRIYDDATVTSSGAAAPAETYYPAQVDAKPLHAGGTMGGGVTVAVLG